MKTYKVGNRIVKADSVVKAVKIAKMLDSPNTRVKMMDGGVEWLGAMKNEHVNFHLSSGTGTVIKFGSRRDYDRALELADKYNYDRPDWDPRKLTMYDKAFQTVLRLYRNSQSTHDSEIDELTQEEQQAVEDYREAIRNTSNPKLLKIYSHILEEETEHLQELAQAKEFTDSSSYKDFSYEKINGVWVIEHKSGEKWTYPGAWDEKRVKVELDYKNDIEDSCGTMKDDRLSPMTYKKLKELGVKSEQWSKWTQEQANEFIRQRSQKGQKASENTEQTEKSANKNLIESVTELAEKLPVEDVEELSSGLAQITIEHTYSDKRDATRVQKIIEKLKQKGFYAEISDDSDQILVYTSEESPKKYYDDINEKRVNYLQSQLSAINSAAAKGITEIIRENMSKATSIKQKQSVRKFLHRARIENYDGGKVLSVPDMYVEGTSMLRILASYRNAHIDGYVIEPRGEMYIPLTKLWK